MIAIIDYGMGNLRSVQKGLERVGFDAVVTRDVSQIQAARGVVLPGVGAFSACMENLAKFGLVEPIREIVRQKKPFLGICLGFQLLFSESEEFGKQKGLDLFSGKVVGFHAERKSQSSAHGLESDRRRQQDSPFLEGISSGDYVYFVHSFYVVPDDNAIIATTTDYGQFVRLQHRDGSTLCLPVSPGKKPGVGSAHSRQLRPLRAKQLIMDNGELKKIGRHSERHLKFFICHFSFAIVLC